jgi:hypothetical protein
MHTTEVRAGVMAVVAAVAVLVVVVATIVQDSERSS